MWLFYTNLFHLLSRMNDSFPYAYAAHIHTSSNYAKLHDTICFLQQFAKTAPSESQYALHYVLKILVDKLKNTTN
jgi:uncharacterized protein with NAD-binding domain and iron-sulfur cluster